MLQGLRLLCFFAFIDLSGSSKVVWKNLSASTYLYACSSNAPLTPANVSGWSTVNIDWSTDKRNWAQGKPMDAEETLIANARALYAAGHSVFVYRNVAKALPWFSSVRSVLQLPAYSAWFMNFGPNKTVNGTGYHSPTCDENYPPPLCSSLYHDQTQSPGFPGGDGVCAPPHCDVGAVPVGEYLWNPLAWNVSINGTTLKDYFIESYIFGPNGLGDARVSGAYFDGSFAQLLLSAGFFAGTRFS